MKVKTTTQTIEGVNDAVDMTASLSAQPNTPSESGIKPEPVFLSMHEAAKMTGYHQDYLGQMARSGKLEAYKVGRNWQTTKQAIDKMLGRDKAEAEEKALALQQQKIETTKSESVESISTISEVAAPELITSTPQIKIVTPPVASVMETRPVVKKFIRTSEFKPVSVNKIWTAIEAGPNVQEAVAFCAPQTTAPTQIIGSENKNTFFRLNKLASGKTVVKTQNIFTQSNFSASQLFLAQPEIEESPEAPEKNPWKVLAWVGSVAAVILLAVQIAPQFLSNQANKLLQTVGTPQKMVAGESTSADAESVGTGYVTLGQSFVTIKNDNVKKDSMIMVTFRSDHKSGYWISSQDPGQFTITLSEPALQNLTFDYWVVNPQNAQEGGSP